MQAFVPLEDDWAALESLHPDCLVPYQIDVPVLRRAIEPAVPANTGECAVGGRATLK